MSSRPFREAFFHHFAGRYSEGIKVQTSDQGFQFCRGTVEQCQKLGYFMLFLATMRGFPALSQTPPRKSRGEEKPHIEGSREGCLAVGTSCHGPWLL